MSQPIIEALLTHPRLMSAHTISLYVSLTDEVDMHELINTLLQQGKTLFLPVAANSHTMEIYHYTHDINIGRGVFGIMEPQADAFADYEQIDLILVPGMAFDRRDHQLGRGKDYYDHFPSQARDYYRVGVCFPLQLVDKVPTDEHNV